MPEVQQCAKCGRIIESGEVFVKFNNPNPNQPPFSFTIAAEEIVIGSTFATKFSKFRATVGNTFKSPLDIEIKNSGSASSSRGRRVPRKQACWARVLWVASCC
jgi:hypothetical protein